MKRVVRSWRELVDEQLAVAQHEQLDGNQPLHAQRSRDTAGDVVCLSSGRLGGRCRQDGPIENTVLVVIARGREHDALGFHGSQRGSASDQHRDLDIDVEELLDEARTTAERRPGLRSAIAPIDTRT